MEPRQRPARVHVARAATRTASARTTSRSTCCRSRTRARCARSRRCRDGVSNPQFSPDGTWIAFESRTQRRALRGRGRELPVTAQDRALLQPAQRRGLGRSIGRSTSTSSPVDGTGAPRNLTPGEFQHGGISWLPDSSAIVTSAQRHDTWDLDFARRPLLGRARRTRRGADPGADVADRHLRLPGGVAERRAGRVHRRRRPAHVPAELPRRSRPGEGWRAPLASVASWTGRSRRRPAAVTPIWETRLDAADDRRGSWRDAPRSASTPTARAPTRLTEGPITVKASDAAGGTLAAIIGKVDELSDLYVLRDEQPRAADRLRVALRDRRSHRRRGRSSRCRAPTARSRSTRGSCDRSTSTRPAAYPVLLNVHGGPHTQYGETMFDEAQMQAAAGFVVRDVEPARRLGSRAVVGPGDPRHEAPGRAGHRLGQRRRRRRAVGARRGARALLVLRRRRASACSVAATAGSWRRGSPAATATGSRRSAASAPSTTRSPRSGSSDIGTIFRVEHGPSYIDDPEAYTSISPIRFIRDIHVPDADHPQRGRPPLPDQPGRGAVHGPPAARAATSPSTGSPERPTSCPARAHRSTAVQRAEIILDWFREKLGAGAAADSGAA